jgi:hypothetical protein
MLLECPAGQRHSSALIYARPADSGALERDLAEHVGFGRKSIVRYVFIRLLVKIVASLKAQGGMSSVYATPASEPR